MSRARHKARASGGKLSSKPEWEAGGDSNAAKEAEEKKRGGPVHHAEGREAKHRGDRPKRARGGGVHHHHAVKEKSMEHKHGMHIPGRKKGGGVGANLMPLSTAAKVKHVTKDETPEIGEPSD